MNAEFIQEVLDSPAEGHAAADILIQGDVVLNQNGTGLSTVNRWVKSETF